MVRANKRPAGFAALALCLLSLSIPRAFAQDTLNAENCSSIVKDIHAESGGTVNITVQGADCIGSAGAKLRVTYFWLDNYAAGHVIAGFLPPALRRQFGGNLPVVRNAVFDEMEGLLRRFGVPLELPSSDGGEAPDVSVCFEGADKDEYGDLIQTCESENLQTYGREVEARLPASGLKVLPDTDFFIPLPRAEDVIVKTDRWPEDFAFSYLSDYDAEVIRDAAQNNGQIDAPGFLLWRDARPDELANLSSRLRSYARTFVEDASAASLFSGFPRQSPPRDRADRQTLADDLVATGKEDRPASRLLDFISGGPLPPNLAYAYLSDNACDGVWQFRVAGPEIKLLVAIVENAGSQVATVTALDALIDRRSGLRPLSGASQLPDESWQPATLPLSQQVFKPGEAVLVPLRIEFHARSPMSTIGPEGAATYEAIRELAPDAPLKLRDSEVTKSAAGFGPHVESPQLRTFVFGPEILLRAAQLDEQQIALRQIDPGAISMMVGYMTGSCPYVYGYDSSRDEWRLQSRAIVGATNRRLAYEDSFPLEHFDGRLRITEVDPEASFIDDIAVRLTLADGSTVDLAPDDQRLKARDGSYFVIIHPQTAEIDFPGFADIDQPVTTVTAHIYGYYREFGIAPETVSSRARGPMCRRGSRLF